MFGIILRKCNSYVKTLSISDNVIILVSFPSCAEIRSAHGHEFKASLLCTNIDFVEEFIDLPLSHRHRLTFICVIGIAKFMALCIEVLNCEGGSGIFLPQGIQSKLARVAVTPTVWTTHQ